MLKFWLELGINTLKDPQNVLRSLLDRQFSLTDIAMTAAFLSALGVISIELLTMISPPEPGTGFMGAKQPITSFFIQFMVTVLGAIAIFVGGRLFGGKGSLADSLLALTWLEFVLFLVQIVQIIAFLLFPVLGSLILLSAMALLMYLLVTFIMEVHGFTNALAVVAGVFVGFFVVATALLILLVMLGIGMDGMIQNV